MFTGIVEEVATIQQIENGSKSSKLTIKAKKVLVNSRLGDSIAVNGVCLTVTEIFEDRFKADVMAETLRKSNLGALKIGSKVNVERALSLETRLGGHIVSGHIDDTGTITEFLQEDNAIWVTVEAKSNVLKYVVHKGSITIDGISLTVAYVDDYCFKVSIIPHTASETTLLTRKVGEKVNLECDLIGKYVEKLLRFNNSSEVPNKSNIDEKFLMANGFM